MKLSILTATYNRATMLNRLYESIKENLKYNLECEWVVVDDGSIDDTHKVIESFKKENIIDIKYHFQKNSGKMKAINEAVKIATGDLIVDCDSDDYFTENAFEAIEKNAYKILKNENMYGLIFLKSEVNGNISGNKFETEDNPTTMFNLYFKDDIQGEKAIVFDAKIRKLYSHKLEKNEKFVTEARMYYEMDNKYKVLCVNQVIQLFNYEEEGYTKNISQVFKSYPFGYYQYFKEILMKDMRGVIFSKRLYAIKHYVLFGVLTKNKMNVKNIKSIFNKIIYIILYLPGVIKSKRYIK